MRVSAVIPNWNRRDLLLEAIESVRAQTAPVDEIVVIDNGSGDGSPDAAEAAGACVIRLERNTGFSRAVNLGIRESSGDWIAVLNNDVRLERDWLEKLMAACVSDDVWFAAGKLLRASQPAQMDGAFDLLCRGGCAWRAGQGRSDGALWSRSRRVFSAPLTAAIFRRSLFERAGYLDENFDSYLEDVEFGLRCALEDRGGVYVPEAVAYHHGSATLGRWSAETVRLLARNQLLLVAKHYPPDWIARYGWQILVAQLLWGLVAARHGTAWAYAKGKWQGLRKLRNTQRPSHARLDEVLAASERSLRELQRDSGFDMYWRLYFSLA